MQQLTDKLRVEGILFKGFGHIPKFIMLDTDLTIEAKGIYAYFCSFAGSGNSAFPSRDKILKDLSIGKDRYYKHYNLLILNGYLSAEQERRKDEKTGEVYLGNNIYTLIANPKKYVEKREQEDLHKNKGYSRIRNSGMKSLGYGTIAKAPMLDNRLPLQAKGIYAYFCSFAGSGNSAFPKLSNILYHLQISEKTYYKYYGELVKFNYITPIQRNIKGRFSVNDYYINETPDEELVEIKPFSKKSDTEKSIDNPSSLPFSKKSDTQKPYTQKPYTQKSDTQNSDTNNTNSFNTNSIYYNQSINQQPTKSDNLEKDREIEYEIKRNSIRDEMISNQKLPYKYTANRDNMEIAIHLLTEYDNYLEWYLANKRNMLNENELRFSTFKLFNEAIIEMLTTEKMNLKGSYTTYAKVYDKLSEFIEIEEEYMSIGDIMDNAIGDYIKACEFTEIKNPLGYMKSVIWNCLQTGNISVNSAIRRDFGY